MEESITKRKRGGPPTENSSQTTSFDYQYNKDEKPSFESLKADDLQCPICIEMVTEPIRLRCNHLLCRECYEKLVELSSRKCPKCRKWIGGTRQISNLLDTSLWNFIRKNFIHEQIESDRLLALDIVRKERRELYFHFRRESYVLRSSISSQDSSFVENNEDKIEYKKRKVVSDETDAVKVEAKNTVENSKTSIQIISHTSSAKWEAQKMEQEDSLLESVQKRKLNVFVPKLQIISALAVKDQADSIPSHVNFLQEALKEEAKISVVNHSVIDSIELNENKIDKVDSEEIEIVSDYAQDAMKIETKKSVEIALDSIEPTETKSAKVDSHITMSEKKKSDHLLALDIVRKERRELYFRFRRESYVLRSSISSQDSSFGENIEDRIEYKKRKFVSDETDAVKVEAKNTDENSKASIQSAKSESALKQKLSEEAPKLQLDSVKATSEKKKTDLVITIGDILRQKSADVLKRPRQQLNGRKNLLLLIRKNQGNN